MTETGLRARILRREMLCGTFIKTPAIEIIEVLAHSGLDFICLDAEHSSIDRARMDHCLAMAKALGLDCLVRVPEGTPAQILMALDAGATGVVIPHVYSAEKAADVAKASRYGHGGRGYAGSTRSAGYATNPMPHVLAMTEDTVVLGQIEEPEGVEAVDAIAATPGIDGLFVGPADLAVSYGETDMNAPIVIDAMRKVGDATKAHGKSAVTFTPNMGNFDTLHGAGMNMLFFASEHAWMLSGARALVAEFKEATT
jgi:2-keto-3-deoxy-L-rhamnonate aldolase RhmA